jgi:fatty acid desaturase
MGLPGRFGLVRRADGVEWPTWAVLVSCYTIWLASVAWHDVLGAWWMLPAALMVTLHSSLQHEALHGHPTRSAALNEALVFPALGLFVPYRSFRETHLRHHNDANLTDPYDDPESWYLPLPEWNRAGSARRRLLNLNNTLAGRLL